jgi:hypothetical protein
MDREPGYIEGRRGEAAGESRQNGRDPAGASRPCVRFDWRFGPSDQPCPPRCRDLRSGDRARSSPEKGCSSSLCLGNSTRTDRGRRRPRPRRVCVPVYAHASLPLLASGQWASGSRRAQKHTGHGRERTQRRPGRRKGPPGSRPHACVAYRRVPRRMVHDPGPLGLADLLPQLCHVLFSTPPAHQGAFGVNARRAMHAFFVVTLDESSERNNASRPRVLGTPPV